MTTIHENIENTLLSHLTPQGSEAFLAGDFVDGIGPVYARRLVEKYGPDVIFTLRDDPASITGIPGLGATRIEAASKSLREVKPPLDLLLFLYSCGIPELFIGRILGKYRKRAAAVVTEDPYEMVEDVWRLSFFTADKIGRILGFAVNDPRRLRGALLSAVKHYAEEGHLFATPEEAISYAASISGASEEDVEMALPGLIESGRLVKSRGGLYLPVYYEAEKNGAGKLKEIASAPSRLIAEEDIPVADSEGHVYSSSQREAIRVALESPVCVITGGPGSGKTTVLKGILDILSGEGKKFVLTAPTGRAAKRMSSLSGFEAQTIHRLLGYRQGEGYYNKKIVTDVLVIDEGSMMEQVLFDHLLEAIGNDTKIIMVGDVDQLPAIGAGDVMREMIASGTIPVVRLTENFRQTAGGRIAQGAVSINAGELPALGDEELLFFEEEGLKAIRNKTLELIARELPERFDIRPEDIIVVTPQQMGPLGARALNADLQERLNPAGAEIKRGTTIMRLGDPVMQTANSRERDLYNGETGRIVEVDPEGRWLVVEFGVNHRSRYDRSDLSELVLAYATTVHKLQGSEVEYMVMPLTLSHRPMLYRNLLYTAVSRARRLCALVGEKEALRMAVENSRSAVRNSNFAARLSS